MDRLSAGIWIDSKKAYIILPDGYDCKVVELESDLEMNESPAEGKAQNHPFVKEGSSSSAFHIENVRKNRMKKYLKEVAGVVESANHIYILGPGPTKNSLKNVLSQSDEIYGMLDIDLEDAGHLPLEELKTEVLAHFNKSKRGTAKPAFQPSP